MVAKSKRHIIITGTGRAGTTFLIQLFTSLGFDTGFTNFTSNLFLNCNAGMEWDFRKPNSPYVIKSPHLCDYLDDVLETKNVIIEHAIVPVRDLYSAAESRRNVTRTSDEKLYKEKIPGGLWHTDNPDHQEAILTKQLYKLIYTITKWDIPITLMHFPRLVQEGGYLYSKIKPILNGISYENALMLWGYPT
jgi:hypothetical protein